MTERERRELGLPPSPAQIALTENIRKDAEARMRDMTDRVNEAMAPALRAAKEIHEATDFYRKLSAPVIIPSMDPSFSIPAISRVPHSPPVDYEILADKIAARITTPSDIELSYNRANGELSRTILGKKLLSAFENTKSNKRKKLFERLFRANGKFVKTDDLMEELACSDNQALSKIVQAINRKVRRDLRVPKLVKGHSGSGYRIIPGISILKA